MNSKKCLHGSYFRCLLSHANTCNILSYFKKHVFCFLIKFTVTDLKQ